MVQNNEHEQEMAEVNGILDLIMPKNWWGTNYDPITTPRDYDVFALHVTSPDLDGMYADKKENLMSLTMHAQILKRYNNVLRVIRYIHAVIVAINLRPLVVYTFDWLIANTAGYIIILLLFRCLLSLYPEGQRPNPTSSSMFKARESRV